MESSSLAAAENVSVLVSIDDSPSVGGEMGLFGRNDPKIVEFSAEVLRESLRSTVEGLQTWFGGIEQISSRLPLTSVTVSFEITATGKVAILGTGSEVSGTGAISITFGGGA